MFKSSNPCIVIIQSGPQIDQRVISESDFIVIDVVIIDIDLDPETFWSYLINDPKSEKCIFVQPPSFLAISLDRLDCLDSRQHCSKTVTLFLLRHSARDSYFVMRVGLVSPV